MLAVMVIITAAALAFSCAKVGPPPAELPDEWCSLPLASGNTATGLGPMDYNAGYNGFLANMGPGERAVLHAFFPHARYASVMVYDRDFLLLDTILDVDIEPLAGVNPFIPGTERSSDYLGEFEIQIVMSPPPKEGRAPNTLYAGLTLDGKPNDVAVVGYRVYMPDQGMTFKDGNPLAVYGGVPPPRFRIVSADGSLGCPDPRASKSTYYQVFGGLVLRNWRSIMSPTMGIGELSSPPVWINTASEKTQKMLTFVPCPDTNYIMTPISKKFGELLVFRWKQARIPGQVSSGKPFPPGDQYDIRYWSLSFDYFDRTRAEQVFGEKTVADIEVPVLPDGTSQLVVGFGGMARPESVPPGQWVGLQLDEGIAVVRNIVVNPEFAGYFWKLAPGPLPSEYDQYSPGGVYCSAAEFAKNPDIGLSRMSLMAKAR